MLGIRFNTRQFYLAFYNLLVLISEVSCIALFGPQLPYNSGLGYGLLGNGILGLPVPFIPRYGNLGYGGFGWGPEDSTKSGRGKRSTDANDDYNAYNNIYRSDENHGDSYSSKFKSYIPEVSEDKPLELNEFYADLNKSIYVEDEGGNPNFNLLMAVPEFNNVYSYLSEAYGGNSLELDSDLDQLDNSDDSDSEDSDDTDSDDSDSDDSDSDDTDSDDSDSDDTDSDDYNSDSDNESDSDEDNEDSDDEDNEDSDDEDNEDSEANEDSDDEAANEDSDDEAAANEDSDDEAAANEDSDEEAAANEDSDEEAAANEDSDDEMADNEDSEVANADSDETNKDNDSSNEHSGNSEGLVNGSNNFEGNNSQELDSRNSRHLDYYMRNMNTHARALPDPYDFSPIHSSHVDLNNILVSGHYNHMESVEEMNPHDRTGRTERARQRPIYSSGYTPYNHYGDNDFLVSGHFVPEIGPGQLYSDFKTNEYW